VTTKPTNGNSIETTSTGLRFKTGARNLSLLHSVETGHKLYKIYEMGIGSFLLWGKEARA
jgi:hypothetical protein